MAETAPTKEPGLNVEAQIGAAIIADALGLGSDFRVEVNHGEDDSVDVVILPAA